MFLNKVLNRQFLNPILHRNFGIFDYFKTNKSTTKQTYYKPEDTEEKEGETEKHDDDKPLKILTFEESSKFIKEKIKKYDYYSYIIGNTLPEPYQSYYFSYNAFYSELIKSRFISKENSVCKMRLMFWEDSLINILKGNQPQEPVCVVLKEAIEKSPIRKDTLLRMIDFQYFDLEKEPGFDSMEELEIYAENTKSLLIYLNLNLLGIEDKNAFLAASHVGRGVGIIGILKQMTTMFRLHHNFIPKKVMEKNGCNHLDLWDREGVASDELFDCILEIAAYAKKHIEISREFKDKIPKNTHIAFLNTVESYLWLSELEKSNFNIFDPALNRISTYKIPKTILDHGKKGIY